MQGWDFVAPELYTRLVQEGDRPTRHLQHMPVTSGSTITMPCIDVPVPGQPGHWTLLVISFPPCQFSQRHGPRATVCFFDPMGDRVTANHLRALQSLRKQFRDVRRVPENLLWVPDEVTPFTQTRVQHGVIDCGIWVMAVARALLSGDPFFIPTARHIPGLRVLLVAEEFAGTRLPVTYFDGWFMRPGRARKLASVLPKALPTDVSRFTWREFDFSWLLSDFSWLLSECTWLSLDFP